MFRSSSWTAVQQAASRRSHHVSVAVVTLTAATGAVGDDLHFLRPRLSRTCTRCTGKLMTRRRPPHDDFSLRTGKILGSRRRTPGCYCRAYLRVYLLACPPACQLGRRRISRAKEIEGTLPVRCDPARLLRASPDWPRHHGQPTAQIDCDAAAFSFARVRSAVARRVRPIAETDRSLMTRGESISKQTGPRICNSHKR